MDAIVRLDDRVETNVLLMTSGDTSFQIDSAKYKHNGVAFARVGTE